jgi:hypothetical protein
MQYIELSSSLQNGGFLQALDGFIVVLSSAGNILYVSETVSGHLGHSQVSNYLHLYLTDW